MGFRVQKGVLGGFRIFNGLELRLGGYGCFGLLQGFCYRLDVGEP